MKDTSWRATFERTFFIWLTVGVIQVIFIACGGNNTPTSGGGKVPKPTFTGTLKCSYQSTSPKGVIICSGDKIDPRLGMIIDKQLDDLFRISGNGVTTTTGTNNYHACPSGTYDETGTCFSTHATYEVYLVPRSPDCVYPGFTEQADGSGYDEVYTDAPANHYDKDPSQGHVVLCAAGFMATGHGQMAGIKAPGMAVVDDVDAMASGNFDIIRYEGEHNLLAQVDTARYSLTQYHYGDRGGHPILGDDVPAVPLSARKKTAKRATPPTKDATPQVKDAAGGQLWVVR